MSFVKRLSEFVDARFLSIIAVLALVRLFSPDTTALIYFASFVYHAINLQTFIFRSGDSRTVMYQSLAF
ncbi:MAG: hypothetical protein MI757_15325, partial [Pirellulales bacterium]|nr:hypothetical protein [Pirellulales bacterium]